MERKIQRWYVRSLSVPSLANFVVRLVTIIVSQMVHHRSHYAMQFQVLLGDFLWTSGISLQHPHAPTPGPLHLLRSYQSNTARTLLEASRRGPLHWSILPSCDLWQYRQICPRCMNSAERPVESPVGDSCSLVQVTECEPGPREALRVAQAWPRGLGPPLLQGHPTFVRPAGEYPAPALPPRCPDVGQMGPWIFPLQIPPRSPARSTQVRP